ncbi:hypothetical protein M3152_16535 [Sporosarcina luteola]|uniref:hypothetical protein n=1 Tax=Bacillales TaxID=1385 RepID=UPI00203FDCEB|nr:MULTISPECIES: hypothetical protein [Bacillales]MCM3639309.1 hypothetical protein [Sporosarcina luteola]
MDRSILLIIGCILAGFALLKAPLSSTFLAGIEPITNIIGILAILLFSLLLLYKGLMSLVGK